MLQSPARNGMKGVASRAPEVDVEQRIEKSVLVRRNHGESLPEGPGRVDQLPLSRANPGRAGEPKFAGKCHPRPPPVDLIISPLDFIEDCPVNGAHQPGAKA